MAEVTLTAEVGRQLGSRATRRLRREGKIPGVIYGHGTDPVAVAVAARELRIALNGEAGANQLLSLDTGSGTYLTLARDMQRHPIAQTVTHVDFQIVRRDEIISADVSIVLTGEALEVQHGDGLVDQQMFTISINARPSDIPTSVELDITNLVIGEQFRDFGPGPAGRCDHRRRSRVRGGHRPAAASGHARRRASEASRAAPREPLRRRGRRTPATRVKHCVRCSGDPNAGARRRICSWSVSAIPDREFEGTLHNVGADAVELVAQRAGALAEGREGLDGPGRHGHHGRAQGGPGHPHHLHERLRRRPCAAWPPGSGLRTPPLSSSCMTSWTCSPGVVRLKKGGGLAGHNGLRSIQSHLHTTDFARVRIGVGKPPSASAGASHVLKRPPKAVRELLDVAVQTAAEAVEHIVDDGFDAATQWCHSQP